MTLTWRPQALPDSLRLVLKDRRTGRYEVNFDANHLASGLYIYRLQVGATNQYQENDPCEVARGYRLLGESEG